MTTLELLRRWRRYMTLIYKRRFIAIIYLFYFIDIFKKRRRARACASHLHDGNFLIDLRLSLQQKRALIFIIEMKAPLAHEGAQLFERVRCHAASSHAGRILPFSVSRNTTTPVRLEIEYRRLQTDRSRQWPLEPVTRGIS